MIGIERSMLLQCKEGGKFVLDANGELRRTGVRPVKLRYGGRSVGQRICSMDTESGELMEDGSVRNVAEEENY